MMFVNLYASCGQWKEANRWRERMNESGIAKTAGGSTIEVDGKFYRFLAGDISMDQDLHSDPPLMSSS
ncbi:putative pentatricopeptide repeat-containing protein, chloroplastic [Vitis vinifera]|uniref:Putative pentatricopeptide repeat-containing protein, chloroplastic n=1 Tax=Vitis vinifera TaxID=29760 RepID=A0A438KFD7_VITVI|nr:putative pentatricopeptide repeat-containing protein, chloroplastic [Vitis vinifera]